MLMATVLTWCENIFVGCTVATTFFGISPPFLIISSITKKILYVGSLIISPLLFTWGALNCYIHVNTGVRDLPVAFFKANSTQRNDISGKNLLCGSRKYPYPHHGRLFDLHPPPPRNFRSRGSLVTPPPPRNFQNF